MTAGSIRPKLSSMRFLSIFLFLLLASPLWGQAADKGSNKTTEAAEPQESEKIRALRVLVESLRTMEAERTAQRDLLKKATTDEQKKEISDEIDRLSAKIREIRNNFTTTATGINFSQSTAATEAATSLQAELRNILQPALRELREATAQPREIENLRIQVTQWKEQLATAQSALAQIDELLGQSKSPELTRELNAIRNTWSKRLIEAEGTLANTNVQLEQRIKNAPSVLNLIAGMLSHFWKNRGLSLLLALIAFIITLVALRRVYQKFRTVSPLHRRYTNSLGSRLFDAIANTLIVVAAVFATVLTLYIRNDWLMLTVFSILFIGLIWASRTALPPYFDQIRLILNLGTVREGERIIYQGLPWRVDALNFFCILHNPDLQGATLKLPAKELLPYHSRPSVPDEPWFPSQVNDWVILDDGVMGRIAYQTPEQVVLVKLGGATKTYSTSSFLSKNPENISSQYSVSTTFGLDYRYQQMATSEIPAILARKAEAMLIETFGKEKIVSVNAVFASAAASSLEFRIFATVIGELAPQFNVIQRMLQCAAVEASNEQGWVIPFPQLTLHQATPS